MKRRSLLVLLPLLLGTQACKPILYPLARAFGGPSEGELKLRRVAFDHLKAAKDTARILVYPMVDPRRAKSPYDAATADSAAALARGEGLVGAVAATVHHTVPPSDLGGNQMRYTQDRAKAYAAWTAAHRPDADFVMFLEAMTDAAGSVGGIQIYVLEASGQVAYVRLYNSHHFNGTPPNGADNVCGVMLRTLKRDLQRLATDVHPPYGVG